MSFINKAIYNVLCLARNKKSLNIINRIASIDDYNQIIPKIYLGNINCSTDIDFLKKHNIGGIINCTENEPFHEYFDNKPKLRLLINDSKEQDNINNFKTQIINSINFIDDCIKNDKTVYVHCYWGLMRSATVVACYIIKQYKIPSSDAINIVREQRPFALSSVYNFNEILNYVESKYANAGN